MKLQRTKNAVRNIIFGFLFRLIAIIGPFAVRTVMIYVMGNDYVGLNSLFTSILSFLSLAELGVGSALVYSMYKPIAEDDSETICALLNLYRRLYRYIGLIILTIGIILLPFLKYLVKDGVPDDVSLYVLYLIYLGNTVISYFMFAYKQSLLTAHQRTDIISKRSIVLQTFMYVMQIIVMLAFRNYYLYIIWLPVSTVITNIANSIIVDKMFPQYKCRGEVPKEQREAITKKIIALFGTKANSVIMHAADNIVISAVLGLTIVGKYGNYYYIMNAIIGIMTTVYDSITAGIGNSLETESKEKVYQDFNVISFLNSWITIVCTVCLLCLYQPFMEIWVKKENMLDFSIVLLLAVYFYIYQIRRVMLTYKDAAGIWWEDRFRPYIMIIVNVTANLILVHIIGLNGVIFSTILSMLVSVPWENYTVFKYIFRISSGKYYIQLLFSTLICVLICTASYYACLPFRSGVAGLIIKAVICFAVSNILFILINIKNPNMKNTIKLVKSKLKRKMC